MLHIKPDSIDISADAKVVKAKDYAAKLRAEDIIKQAQEKAAQIIKDAEVAFEEEKKRGYDQGVEEGNDKISELLIDTVAKSVENFEEFENDIVNIVVQALRKIIGDMDKKELIVGVVRNAMEQVRNQKKVTVIVNPTELECTRQQVDSFLKEFPMVNYISVESDPRIAAGGCKLETDMGVVDASLEKQLATIKKSLEKAVK